MEPCKFIFEIEAQQSFTVLSRVIEIFSRKRISIMEINSIVRDGISQHITLSVVETKESVVHISKRISREIDIVEVNLFEKSFFN